MATNTHHMDPDQGDRRPIPDPTKLTDAAIARAQERTDREFVARDRVYALQKEIFDRDMAALKEFFQARLASMEKATQLYAENLNRVPSDTTSQVTNLRDFVTMRFHERDLRTNQWQTDTKEALANARNSADRAVIEAKDSQMRHLIETKESMSKRCDNIEAQQRGFDDRLRGLMPRTESEGLHRTSHERNEQLAGQVAALSGRMDLRDERGKGMHQGWVAIVAAVSFLVTVGGFIMMILSRAG